MSVQRTYPVDVVGTERLITEPFTINSLRIDNPSGMWLYVLETGTYIPPNTLGWISNITPPSNTVHLTYVNSLVGGIASTVTGGPILITLYDSMQPPSYGLAYTAATAADVTALQAAIAAVQAAVVAQDPVLDAIAQNTQAVQSGFTGGAITSTTAAAVAILANATAGVWIVAVHNAALIDDYYGPSGVTTANGFPLAPNEKNAWVLANGVGLYVRNSGASAHNIRYLLGRIDQ